MSILRIFYSLPIHPQEALKNWSIQCKPIALPTKCSIELLVLSCITLLNQSDMAKQLLTPLRLIAGINFSLKNYSCELLNLTRMVGKVRLISTFATTVYKSWHASDKYTWDNAGDLTQLSMDQNLSENNRSD